MNFTQTEKDMLIDALGMALASNKRMQTSKPQFKAVFDDIDSKLTTLLAKIKSIKISDK